MRFLILQLVAAFTLAGVLWADDLTIRPLTPNEQIEVKQKLGSFENSEITLEALTESPESSQKLIQYYLAHTNEVSSKMKLPVSRGYALLCKAPEAAQLVSEYINVYSNDWRGWRVLGGAKLMMKSYNEAIVALTNAARLGDDENYTSLGGAALLAKRMDVFENMAAPHLLVMMNDAKRFPKDERLEMRGLLIVYALMEEKKGIFIKAVEGVEVKDIVSDENLKNQVAYGCEIFKGKDIDKIRQKFGSENDSKTNAVSSPSP